MTEPNMQVQNYERWKTEKTQKRQHSGNWVLNADRKQKLSDQAAHLKYSALLVRLIVINSL